MIAASCGETVSKKEASVSSLLVRHVDDVLRARFKARAHHRSLEEAQETLRSALARDADGEESLLQLAARLFGPERGVDLDLPPRVDVGQRPAPDFSGLEHGR